MKLFIRSFIVCGLTLGVFSVWTATSFIPTAAAATKYYVSPAGSDTNDGTTLNTSFKTIQRAVNGAQPGDTIELASGEYREDVISRRDGIAGTPITITGPKDAIIKGGGNDRIIEINHDYHILNGFTVDGLHGSKNHSSGYRDILIYVLGKEVRQGVEGLKIMNMTLKNAGGECVRLRYFVTKSEIANNTITNCGVYDFVFNAGGKNGEGIYIGTSSKQWKDGKNPTSDPDETKDNIVHDNYIETNGNECIEIKEGATANIIERNTCRGQKDPESGGLDSRGSGNIFRYNDVRSSVGSGIRLGGWLVKGIQYGKDNDVYGNTIVGNKNGGVKFQTALQGKVCGNTMSGNITGDSVGTFASKFDPTQPCKEGTLPISNPVPSQTSSPASIPISISTPSSLALLNPAQIHIPTPLQISNFTQQLFFGLHNDDVKRLQDFLSKDPSLYPEKLITGYFGPLTRNAVQRFQCRHGIVCSGNEGTTGYGRVGPRTLQKLNQILDLFRKLI